MTDARRTAELELTIQSLQRSLYEATMALDRAFEAKQRLIADHADERKRRQGQDVELAAGREVVRELRRLLAPLGFGNPEVEVALASANTWLERRPT
jgi:hypothetical protein